MTRFADSGGRKRASGELQSAARGVGELPISLGDVQYKKSRPNDSGGSKILFMRTVSSSSHRNSG